MTQARAFLVVLAIVVPILSAGFSHVAVERARASHVESADYGTTYSSYDILVVTTDKRCYLPGEPVNITATLPNGFFGTFPTSCTMYYMILDSNGKVIYDMRVHYYWLMVITYWNVGPGYSRSFIWNQLDDQGNPVTPPKWLQAVVVIPAWGYSVSAYTKFEINPMPTSFDISLVPGWNLVSMPLLNDSWSAGEIGLEAGSVVVGWDAFAQGYSNPYVVGVSPEITDFRLIAGRSYFIYTQEAQTMTVFGCSSEVSSQYFMSLPVPSGGGWVCIGFSSLLGQKASDVDDLVKGARVNLVCKWNASSGVYQTYIPGHSPPVPPVLDFVIGPGEGCWLLVDGPGTLTYSP